jgi:hypothetical protein
VHDISMFFKDDAHSLYAPTRKSSDSTWPIAPEAQFLG